MQLLHRWDKQQNPATEQQSVRGRYACLSLYPTPIPRFVPVGYTPWRHFEAFMAAHEPELDGRTAHCAHAPPVDRVSVVSFDLEIGSFRRIKMGVPEINLCAFRLRERPPRIPMPGSPEWRAPTPCPRACASARFGDHGRVHQLGGGGGYT